MTTQNEQTELVQLPIKTIGLLSLLACVVIAISAGYLSTQRGGGMNDGLIALFATIPGVLVIMGILMSLPPKHAGAWSVPVIMGTALRALIVLSIGLAIYFTISPDKFVFFLTLLASLMIALIIDVVAVLSLIQKHTPAMAVAGDSEGIS